MTTNPARMAAMTGLGSVAERNRIAILVRWILLACIAGTSVVLRLVSGWPSEPLPILLICSLLAVANATYQAHLTRVAARGAFRTSRLFIQWQGLPDIVLLTLLTYFTGGLESPFLYAPVLALVLAGGLAQRPRAALALAALAVLLTADLIGMSELGLLSYHGPAAVRPVVDEARIRQIAGTLAGFDVLSFVAAGGTAALILAMQRRNNELSDSARHYRGLLENVDDLVFAADRQGRLTFANRAMEAATGYTAEELVGRDATGLLTPVSGPGAATVEADPAAPVTVEWATKAGAPLRLSAELTPILVDGRRVGTRGVARDPSRRTQVEDDLRQRIAEIGALYQASAQIGSSLNLEETLQSVVGCAAQVTGGSAACVILLDAQRRPELRVATGAMAAVPLDRIMRPNGVSARVAESGDAAVFPDLSRAPEVNPALVASGAGAALCLPLKEAEGAIGVMWVAWPAPRKFAQADVQLLQTFGDQIAGAITNARRYAREQRRGRLLETVSILSRQTAAPLALDVMLDRAVRTLQENLAYPTASVLMLDERSRLLVPRAIASSYPTAPAGYAGQPMGTGIVGRAATEGRAIVVSNVAQDARYVALFPETRSELALPLMYGGAVLGILNLESDEPGAFPHEDASVLETVADQLAVAIHNARMFQEVSGRAQATGMIHQATVDMSGAISLDQVLEITLRTAQSLAEADESSIYLVAPGRPTYEEVLLDADGRLVRNSQNAARRGVGLTGIIEKERRPLVVEDAEAGSGGTDGGGARLYCSAGVPMIAGDQVAGVLYVTRYNKPPFPPQQTETLSILANSAAVALANARLQADRERVLAELSALNQIANAINSVLELDQVLAVIRDQVGKLVENENFTIALCDEAGGTVTFPLAYLDGSRVQLPERSGGNGLVEYVIRTREPLLVRGDMTEALQSRGISHIPVGWEPQSWLGVPLMVRDRVVGVMSVQCRKRDRFDASHQQMLMSVGAQAAIALEKARLYRDLTDQARRDSLTQVYNHGYFLECLGNLVAEDATPLSLIMLDIDHFKKYNDRYGHVSGDLVLQAIVQAIRQHIHREDVVGRWGGEEFGILLARTNSEGAKVVAERIRETLATTPINDATGHAVLKPTVSQGIATYPDTAESTGELVNRADAALYWAKAAGRDQISVAGTATDSEALAAVDEGRI